MAIYDDQDRSTPHSLLDETVTFAREILNALGSVQVSKHKKFSGIYSIGVECCTAETPDFIRKMYADKGAFIAERDSFEAPHPAVSGSFRSIIEKLMNESGFTRAKAGERAENHQQNKFSIGEIADTTSIMSFAIDCNGSPEKLCAALMPTEDQLRRICLEALNENLARMSVFGDMQKETGLDPIPKSLKPARRPSP